MIKGIGRYVTIDIGDIDPTPPQQDDDARLYIWDVKSHLTQSGPDAQKSPWKFFAPGDVTHAKKMMAVLFESPENPDDRLMRDKDVAMFFDGRYLTGDLKSALSKSLKTVPLSILPTRKMTANQLHYHDVACSVAAA